MTKSIYGNYHWAQHPLNKKIPCPTYTVQSFQRVLLIFKYLLMSPILQIDHRSVNAKSSFLCWSSRKGIDSDPRRFPSAWIRQGPGLRFGDVPLVGMTSMTEGGLGSGYCWVCWVCCCFFFSEGVVVQVACVKKTYWYDMIWLYQTYPPQKYGFYMAFLGNQWFLSPW